MNHFAGAKRLVFKVGTSTLTHETGKLNLRRMRDLARVLSDLKKDVYKRQYYSSFFRVCR